MKKKKKNCGPMSQDPHSSSYFPLRVKGELQKGKNKKKLIVTNAKSEISTSNEDVFNKKLICKKKKNFLFKHVISEM